MEKLKKLRDEIDDIDKQIVELIEKRMKVSVKVGELKKENNIPVFDAEREKELIEEKIKLLKNKDLSNLIITIYNDIMSVSKSLQKNLIEKDNKNKINKKIDYNKIVAYQGREGGNGYEAAKNEVLDILVLYNCKIVGEIYLPIEYGLMAKKGDKIKDIKKVISHPQALKQCSDFIKKNNFEELTASNTAEAAYIVSKSEDNSLASISNKNAAKIYNLEILKENIENIKGNTTRFIIVSNYDNALKNGNKMTIRFLLPHENGSLANALLKLKNFNLTSIVSRPHRERKWQYYFYIDMTGNFDESTLDDFKNSVENFTILGIYDE
ncbi:MAG: chorismate mutase [Brachyspira sp.]|nr:chorismate mutase [Brachyspira sp.]